VNEIILICAVKCIELIVQAKLKKYLQLLRIMPAPIPRQHRAAEREQYRCKCEKDYDALAAFQFPPVAKEDVYAASSGTPVGDLSAVEIVTVYTVYGWRAALGENSKAFCWYV
jgi:hypothetical protein